MALLDHTASTDQIDASEYDAIYFARGHGTMSDFDSSEGLQRIASELFERGGVVSAVCHGYCGLLNAKLSDGSNLIAGRRLTGFSWNEEILAGVSKIVPYNVEEAAKDRGAHFSKALLPFLLYTVVDGNLVTGQNPSSAKKTAEKVVELL